MEGYEAWADREGDDRDGRVRGRVCRWICSRV